jgi:uncharacterized DUF497 family protein
MRFEWDDKKAESNQKKHKVSFETAITAFDDPFALIAPDEKHSNEIEIREWLIGESDSGVLVVVFTHRAKGAVYRLISARRASRKERKRYEELKRVSI